MKKWLAVLLLAVKPAIDKIKDLWKKLVSFTSKWEFLMMFPLIIFAFSGIYYGSLINVVAFFVWLIPAIGVLNEKED